ncbi:MAG: hypothetical protein PHI97_04860 [Desulfobulbus sp.]|nr:hypothetical protein [Desulfobulbus sp.]
MTTNPSPNNNQSPKSIERTARPNLMLIPRLLASLLSLFIVGLGFQVVLSAHYFARSGKLGVEITVDGPPAIAMGIGLIFWGLIPLTLWFTSRRFRIVWLIFCILSAAVFFGVSASLHHG